MVYFISEQIMNICNKNLRFRNISNSNFYKRSFLMNLFVFTHPHTHLLPSCSLTCFFLPYCIKNNDKIPLFCNKIVSMLNISLSKDMSCLSGIQYLFVCLFVLICHLLIISHLWTICPCSQTIKSAAF